MVRRRLVVAALLVLLLVVLPVDVLAAEDEHGEGILPTIAKLVNFGILVGVLVYYLRAPIREYSPDPLRTRSARIW